MNLNIREGVLKNMVNNDQQRLRATIVDGIQSGKDNILPGLGVLFELIWKQSNEIRKGKMLNTLEQGLRNAENVDLI